MKKFKTLFLILIALLIPLFASCASDSPKYNGASDGDNNLVAETTRKIYYTVDYDIRSKDYKEIKIEINNKVEEYLGYIQDSEELDNYSRYVYRVPTESLNTFLDYIDSYGNDVSNKRIRSTDVTSNYSQLEARKEVLLASREAYMNILKETTLIADIIQIQDKLDDIDTEILTIEKEIASYDNLINYSTITIEYRDEYETNPLADYGDYLINIVKYTGVAILYVLPFVLMGGTVLLVIMLVKKKRDNKNIK